MKFGVWTPLPHIMRDEPGLVPGAGDAGFAFAASFVARAEALGFDITLVAERLLGPDLEAWMLTAALAAVTRRIELMVAVHPGIATPQMVAKMAVSLDRISGGRASLNIVNGWWREEMDIFGNGAWLQDEAARAARMQEFIAVLRALWNHDAADYDGAYYAMKAGALLPRPVRAGLPIYAASRSDAGKQIIARDCDCWFVEFAPDRRRFDDNLASVARDIADMRARAARHGRTLEFGLSAHVICADTTDEAEAQALDLEAYGARDRTGQRVANALGAGLIGTAEVVAGRIRQWEQAGVSCLMLRFYPMFESLERFGASVLPLLRGAP